MAPFDHGLLQRVVAVGRCHAISLRCGLAVVLGCGLVLLLGCFGSPPLRRCRMLSSACGLGVDVAGQDDRVQGQPSGERRDPSNGGNDIVASAEHKTAVDDDPEELLVRSQGILLEEITTTSPPRTRSWKHRGASVAEVAMARTRGPDAIRAPR